MFQNISQHQNMWQVFCLLQRKVFIFGRITATFITSHQIMYYTLFLHNTKLPSETHTHVTAFSFRKRSWRLWALWAERLETAVESDRESSGQRESGADRHVFQVCPTWTCPSERVQRWCENSSHKAGHTSMYCIGLYKDDGQKHGRRPTDTDDIHSEGMAIVPMKILLDKSKGQRLHSVGTSVSVKLRCSFWDALGI